jgi:hypothetical protein
MTAEASVVTLKGALAHGAPAPNVPVVYSAVLKADGEDGVTLTPEATTKLTFSAEGKGVTQQSSASEPAAHGITIGGEATLVASATYTVASEDGKVGTLTIADSAVLTIGAGALLDGFDNTTDSAVIVLTGATGENGAKLDGEGTVVAGATEITGGGSSGLWQAVGADTTIVIAVNSISGTGDDAKLVGVTDDGAVITQKKGESALTLIDATIDLSTKGKLTLEGDAHTPGTLVLAGATSVISTGDNTGGSGITVIGKIGSKDITQLTIGIASGNVAAAYENSDKKLGFLAGIAAGPVSVVPGEDNISFVKDVAIAAPD